MNENERVRPTMVSVSRSTDENATQKRAEKKKNIEKQLSENTIKMKRIKNSNKMENFFFFSFNKILLKRYVVYSIALWLC